MAANQDDYFKKTGANTVTTLAAPGKALAANSITVGSTTNYPSDTGIIIGIRQVDSDGVLVAGTYTEWKATVTSGTTFAISTTPELGSDQVYPAGSTTQVFLPISSSAHNDLIDGILISHNQDGSLKAGAVDNAGVLASDVVTTAKILDSNVTTAKIADGAITSPKLAEAFFRGRYQSNTTNSAPTGLTVQYGWGFKVGTGGTGQVNETVTFPVAFSSPPVVMISTLGTKAGSDPASIDELTGDAANVAWARSITASSFLANLIDRDSGSSTVASTRYGYSWIAIGTV